MEDMIAFKLKSQTLEMIKLLWEDLSVRSIQEMGEGSVNLVKMNNRRMQVMD